jgi:hypothetical protein
LIDTNDCVEAIIKFGSGALDDDADKRGSLTLSDVRESAHNRCRERGPRGLSVIEAALASEAAREIDALAMKSTAQEKGKRLEQEDDCTHDDGDRTAAA